MKSTIKGKIKPTRIKSPRIVHHHDSRRRWQLLLALLLLLVIGWQAYSWGVRQGGYDQQRADREIAALQAQVEEQQAKMRDLEAEAIRFRRQAEIETQAGRELQQQLIRIEDEKAVLQSEVEILRSLVSNDSGSLYIKNFSLQAGEQMGRYKYGFTLVQVMEKIATTKGKLVVKVSGKLKKKKKNLGFADFSGDDKKALKLEFSNYKDISGDMQLPEDFKPETIQIEFLPRNKELKKLSKSFSWSDYLQSTE